MTKAKPMWPLGSDLISVLMPTHNVRDYAEQAVRSILEQTYPNLELVIQDDGSTDGTYDVLTELAASDDRIVLLPPFETNRGVIAARNSLLQNFKGEYVAWMDGDDTSDPKRLELQIAFLKANPLFGAVGSGIEYADSHMVPIRKETYPKDPKRQAIDPYLCCATIMARADAVAKAGLFRDAFFAGGEDGDWILKLTDHHDVTNIDDILYTYRQHHSTTKRGAAAIRRLGVLARYSARVRRASGVDPIESLVPDPGFHFLRDELFLNNPELTADEKVTALGLPLANFQPLISVVLVLGEERRFLDLCLDSLAKQAFRNFEVLIADVGSESSLDPEHAEKRLAGIKVTVYRREHERSLLAARDELISLARGEFIALQDSYDFSTTSRLERQMLYMLGHTSCSAVGTSINFVRFTRPLRRQTFKSQAVKRGTVSGCVPSFMLRRSAVERTQDTAKDNRRQDARDTDLLLRISPPSAVHNIDETLYFRRVLQEYKAIPDDYVAHAFQCMNDIVDQHGLALLNADASNSKEKWEAIEHFMELRLDGTEFAKAIARGTLRQVRAGETPLRMAGRIAALYPLAFLLLLVAFARGQTRRVVRVVTNRIRPLLQHSRQAARKASEGFNLAVPVAVTEATANVRRRLQGKESPNGATMIARCYDNWGDLDDALKFLTPHGKGIWNGVSFERAGGPTPDWHIMFNQPSHPTKIKSSPNRVVFAIGEPPTETHRPLQLGQGNGTIVLTSDSELAQVASPPRKYLLEPCMTRTWSVKKTYDELKSNPVLDKPYQLSWVTSNLALIDGHRRRLAFLSQLQNSGIAFDLFGRGFRPIEDKWNGIAPYKYSIAFENTVAPYYFTEKLMDCFVCETMPIYFGSPTITDYFPANAMVIIDPNDPNVFQQIADVIASDLWLTRRDAILEAKRLTLEKYNIFARLANLMTETTDQPLPRKTMTISPISINFGG